MRKTLFVSAFLVALLAGCASGVKLSDVPVEDKGSASAAGIGQGSGVASVVTDKAGSGIGPAGVPHVVYFDYDSFVIKDLKKYKDMPGLLHIQSQNFFLTYPQLVNKALQNFVRVDGTPKIDMEKKTSRAFIEKREPRFEGR